MTDHPNPCKILQLLHITWHFTWSDLAARMFTSDFSKNSWASANSPESEFFSEVPETSGGKSQAALMERSPNHIRRATAAYSPIGWAADQEKHYYTLLQPKQFWSK